MAIKDYLFKPAEVKATTPVPAPASPLSIVNRHRVSSAVTFQASSPAIQPTTTINNPEVQEFMNEIAVELDKSTAPGFKEFQTQMELLAAAIPDERVRIQVAVSTVTSLKGLTVTQLTSSVQERIDRLTKHKENILASLHQEITDKTALNTNHITDLEKRLLQTRQQQITLRDAETAMMKDLEATQSQLQEIQAQSQTVITQYETAHQVYHDALIETLNRLPGTN